MTCSTKSLLSELFYSSASIQLFIYTWLYHFTLRRGVALSFYTTKRRMKMAIKTSKVMYANLLNVLYHFVTWFHFIMPLYSVWIRFCTIFNFRAISWVFNVKIRVTYVWIRAKYIFCLFLIRFSLDSTFWWDKLRDFSKLNFLNFGFFGFFEFLDFLNFGFFWIFWIF